MYGWLGPNLWDKAHPWVSIYGCCLHPTITPNSNTKISNAVDSGMGQYRTIFLIAQNPTSFFILGALIVLMESHVEFWMVRKLSETSEKLVKEISALILHVLNLSRMRHFWKGSSKRAKCPRKNPMKFLRETHELHHIFWTSFALFCSYSSCRGEVNLQEQTVNETSELQTLGLFSGFKLFFDVRCASPTLLRKLKGHVW